MTNKPNPRCKPMMQTVLKKSGLNYKDIRCVNCAVSYFVEFNDVKEEKRAHCKYCAISEVVMANRGD
jgi:hypothetical protein